MRNTRSLALVLWVALAGGTGVSWAQVPDTLGTPQTPGGILDQKRSQGLSLLTVVAPNPEASPATQPPGIPGGLPPEDEKFLCWSVWYANTSGNAWLFLTDAPDTEDGRIFSQEAIKSITSAPATATWTVRRFANAEAVEAESKRVSALLDKAKPAPGGAKAWFTSMVKKVFRLKK